MNTLDYEQDLVDKLGELGLRLRQIREQKQMSLEQVSAKTMIQPRVLQAIEAGKLEQLPEPVYTQGFIRRFAEALDLNGAEFASAFPARPKIKQHSPDWNRLPTPQLRPIHLYLLYVVLIIGAGSGLSYLINRSTVNGTTQSSGIQPQTTPFPETRITPKTSTRPPNSEPLEAGSTLAPVQETVKGQAVNTVQVDVTVKQESWLEIIADGKSEFEGTLPPGTQRRWTAKQKLVVRSGNAGGVLTTSDGTPAQPLGEPGTVAVKSFESVGPPASQPSVNPTGE